ncbi:MAG: NAD(+)/NADH kinase [Bdellovibrionales bacterium]
MRKKALRHKIPNRFLVIYRDRGKEARELANELSEWLVEHGKTVFYHSAQKALNKAKKISSERMFSTMDQVIVIGGDGTYLKAVSYVGERNIPIMGINMGSLGFLTETRVEEMYKSARMLIDGKMKYQERALLRVKILQKGKIKASSLALNDLVLERGPYSRLISLAIYSEDKLVSEMRADGLIIATPTGSTAYNLAAGGPIIHPDAESLVITPICPHSLTNRPLILPDNHKIKLKIQSATDKAYCMIDGQRQAILNPNDEIVIHLAKVNHTLVRPAYLSYFELLNTKLQFGQRV